MLVKHHLKEFFYLLIVFISIACISIYLVERALEIDLRRTEMNIREPNPAKMLD